MLDRSLVLDLFLALVVELVLSEQLVLLLGVGHLNEVKSTLILLLGQATEFVMDFLQLAFVDRLLLSHYVN